MSKHGNATVIDSADALLAGGSRGACGRALERRESADGDRFHRRRRAERIRRCLERCPRRSRRTSWLRRGGRSVRVRDGRAIVTDGPFAETKEAVGGFDILECGSLEEAVEIAAGHPVAKSGTIEVRPLLGN